ncbi:isochorismatase family protein [Streptomyces sp. NPDC002928]|uniref:isochorismatase family protein n=1 Tax=Streptomyces sp. NPDC002928 TaxID=3154440 RepID=UPI0033BB2C08
MTSICVVRPALSARAEGYDVYAVIDASGTCSEEARRISIVRLSRAGVRVADVLGMAAELQAEATGDTAAEETESSHVGVRWPARRPPSRPRTR